MLKIIIKLEMIEKEIVGIDMSTNHFLVSIEKLEKQTS